MKKITSIEHIPEDDNDNFTIKFSFAPNDYFENDTLSVKFTMLDEGQPLKSEGTEIKWKEGKDITKKTVTKTQKNKKTGKTRTVTKTVDAESFFNFFKSITANDEEEGDDEEEEVIFSCPILTFSFFFKYSLFINKIIGRRCSKT